MTTPTTEQRIARRRGAPKKARTLAQFIAGAAFALLATSAAPAWPATEYQEKPVEFFRNVLGVEPWAKQIEVIEAIRDHKRVSVRSGHKVSKSNTAAGSALWFYSSFEDARVVLTSTTSRQVDQILWRELRKMVANSGRCVDCKKLDPLPPKPCPHSRVIPELPYELARSGMKAPDFREIVGFTARESEAVAGISGKNLLYLPDEASGIPDGVFEAIEGNRAGGARLAMFSNPTKTSGEHFESFHGKAKLYKTITISSEDSPNVVEGREVIPGLATREWIEEKKIEWGEESPLYKIRVKGVHVLTESGRIISVHAITEAEVRWEETLAEGRLFLGLDPAGPGLAGDETTMFPRRGKKVLRELAWRGLSEDAIIVQARAVLREEKKEGDELPVILIDREGPIGSSLYGRLRAISDTSREFEVIGVRSSDRAVRQPQIYDRVRDELWACGAEWLRDGGAIPESTKLAKELHSPSWYQAVNGRLKVTPKEDLRKEIGRSTDRADGFLLSVWTPAAYRDAEAGETTASPPKVAAAQRDAYASPSMDPYAGLGTWGGR